VRKSHHTRRFNKAAINDIHPAGSQFPPFFPSMRLVNACQSLSHSFSRDGETRSLLEQQGYSLSSGQIFLILSGNLGIVWISLP